MEPESSASMTNTAGASAGLWSLRKEGPASGYSLDVVVDAEVGQQSFQPLRGAAVLGAVAADDRATFRSGNPALHDRGFDILPTLKGEDSDGRSRVHQGCTRTAHPCGGLTVAHATDAVL